MERTERAQAQDVAARQAVAIRLTTARHKNGISQRAVAAAMGTSQSAVSELEQGTTPDPRISTLQRWARAVGGRLVITVETDEEPIQSPEERMTAAILTLTDAITSLNETMSRQPTASGEAEAASEPACRQ